eukprot:1158135-Pelagomonas_calceolata.AAC.2
MNVGSMDQWINVQAYEEGNESTRATQNETHLSCLLCVRCKLQFDPGCQSQCINNHKLVQALPFIFSTGAASHALQPAAVGPCLAAPG